MTKTSVDKTNINQKTRQPLHKKLMHRGCILAVFLFLAVFYGLAISHTPDSNAAIDPAKWQAGHIIDDSVFYNPDTMTVAQIDDFIKKHNPSCDLWGQGQITGRRYPDGSAIPSGTTRAEYAKVLRERYGRTRYHDAPFVCITEYYENPETHENRFDSHGEIKPGMISAAQIIYNAAHKYNINPQVLLVMIKKESNLWGDNWPLEDQYNAVMGYGCPDNAPCNEKYYGFYNQVDKAAWQLNYYREHIYQYRYRPYVDNNIMYSPAASCGTKNVHLENVATTSLYIYTPYTPNDAALRAYPGVGDSCSSYGNRNFYAFFNEWFGSTYEQKKPALKHEYAQIPSGNYRIVSATQRQKSLHVSGDDYLEFRNISNDTSDQFYISPNTNDDSYRIKFRNAEKSFDVPWSKAEAGKEMMIFKSHNDDNQKWYFYANGDGSYSIATKLNPALVLSNQGGRSQLIEYSKDNKNTRFYLVPTDFEILDAQKNYRIANVATGAEVMDIWGDVIDNKAQGDIGMFRNKGAESDNQTFNFIYDSSEGYYKIKNSSSDLYITLGAAISDSLSGLSVAKAKGDCTQKWGVRKDKDSSYRIFSACNRYDLDLDTSAKKVNSYRHHGRQNQLWRLVEPAKRPLSDGQYTISTLVNPEFAIRAHGYLNNISVEKAEKQYFDFKYDKYWGTYTISSKDGYVLDLKENFEGNGGEILSFKPNGQHNQRWILETNDDGSFMIKSFLARKNIDLYEARPESHRLSTYDPHGRENQRWLIRK